MRKTKNFTSEEIQKILDWLLSQRLRNYGYYWRDFRRLSDYASKLRRKIRQNYDSLVISEKVKTGDFMNGRLEIEDGQVFYVVGQSFNEEYINLMAEILERINAYNRRQWLS